jgi:adenylate cyclase
VSPSPFRRKLAAILVADVAGYSRLMSQDEAGTLEALGEHRRELIDPAIAGHNGRLVKLMGDGLLVEFASVVDAVTCAVAIQRGMAGRNENVPPDRRIEFRIGINLGDVIVEGADLYGDGVNIAARLEGLAEPGGICLSRQAFDQVEGKLDLGFTDLGEHMVKNIARPIRVYRVDLAKIHADTVPESTADAMMARPAVAILPFTNLSRDPEQEYFSDGLTEDLITALAAWRSFPVIARNSSFVYKGPAVDVKRVGRELGARYVLEGSVRKAGNRIRVTAQLVDAETGHHVWAERYDRALEDVFELQDEITRRIAPIIAPELEQTELRKSTAKRSESLTAWDCYLRGAALLHAYTCESNADARAMFERAIALDPHYSEAWTGLAYSHLRDIDLGCTGDREASLAMGFEIVRRAVTLDDASSAAHLCLGQAYVWAEQYDLAIAETEAAVELNPNNARACMALGNRLDLAGRTEEGISQMERSLQLNPRDPNRFVYMGYLARAYVRLGDYETAAKRAREMVRLRPDHADAYYRLAISLGHLGRADEARAALAECERLRPGFLGQRAAWRPYPDAASNDHFFAGLRRLRLID